MCDDFVVFPLTQCVRVYLVILLWLEILHTSCWWKSDCRLGQIKGKFTSSAQPFIIIFSCWRSLKWLLINFHWFQLIRVFYILLLLFLLLFLLVFLKGRQCWSNGYVIPKIIITWTIYFRLTFLVFISFGGHRHACKRTKTWWSKKNNLIFGKIIYNLQNASRVGLVIIIIILFA